MQRCSCYSNKYNEIKMCDLEPFSEIQSQITITKLQYLYMHAAMILAKRDFYSTCIRPTNCHGFTDHCESHRFL